MWFSTAALSLAAIASSPHAVVEAFSPSARGATIVHHHGVPSSAASSSIAARRHHRASIPSPSSIVTTRLYASDGGDDDAGREEEEDPPENPYADPNYPDIEFVNYDDPDYSADRNSEIFEAEQEEDATLAEIEAMREERRRKNDEFQFETYHATVLRGGERSLGEWTVFQTDTFMGSEAVGGRNPEAAMVPRLLKWDKVLKVVSIGNKVVTDPDAEWRVDGEMIVHEERLATADDFPTLMMDEGEGGYKMEWEDEEVAHVANAFWPSGMSSLDFRGPGGNMCVGKAYTICDAAPLALAADDNVDEAHDGPFAEMRTEVGVQENGMRFRVKLDYATLDDGSDVDAAPPLHLRTLTVCRETLDGYWPNPADNESADNEEDTVEVRRKNQEDVAAALFGPPGAPGGLYDPPPVGTEERAVQNYMLLDFEGGATVLLPHRLDQRGAAKDDGNDAAGDFGWVTSLDWTPGGIRYQVDRKVLGGTKLKGLKTLELSEVQGEEADRWRPKDGGENMRQ